MSAWLKSLRRICKQMNPVVFFDSGKTQVIDAKAYAVEPLSEADVAVPNPVNQRAAPRKACYKEVICQREGSRSVGLSFLGRARNVSRAGMGLIVGCRFEPGAVLLIEVPEAPGKATKLLAAVVVHARALPHRGWYLGCEFANPINDGDVQELTP